jgi:flagellar biosynthesis/type III secretory pathway protein FliH
MRTLAKSIALAVLIFLAVPSRAGAGDRDYRDKGRDAAYRAGFENGYRSGLHHGEFDFRAHERFGYRGRDNLRGDRFGFWERHRGDYSRGYREGFRKGYRNGYERYAFPRRPGRAYYYNR